MKCKQLFKQQLLLFNFLAIFLINGNAQIFWNQPEDNVNKGIKLNLPDVSEYWHGTDYLGFGLMVVGGVANGMSEAYEADRRIFEKKWGKGSQSWWGSESWKRKYKDYDSGDERAAYWQSQGVLAWSSDFDHFSEATQAVTLGTGSFIIGLNGRRYKWHTQLIRFVTGFIAYGAASSITYNVLRN